MFPEFSKSLSKLRQEQGISQRVAARDLKISQALLSHYENGIREPGLAFLNRVCDYYNVTADFLLGRTLSREEGAVFSDALFPEGKKIDEVQNSSVYAGLQAKLLSYAVALLFDQLGENDCRIAAAAASDYLSTALYVLFRHLYSFSDSEMDLFAALPSLAFLSGAPNGDMACSEVRYTAALSGATQAKGVPLAVDADGQDRSHLAAQQAMEHLVSSAGDRIGRIVQGK